MRVMLKILQHLVLSACLLGAFISNVSAQERIRISPGPVDGGQDARLMTIRSSCPEFETCTNHHAIVFVHGIFGGASTFGDWPQQLQPAIGVDKVDVYVLEYRTAMVSWLKSDVPNLDSVVERAFDALMPLVRPEGLPRYKSINFVAHSLGGNVVAAYLHSVKSLLGHEIRARHGFVITLGTPVLGAQIAEVAALAKSAVGMPEDRLLESLKRDNTFLRMMRYWRLLENTKSANFGCPSLSLYVGVEARPTWNFVPVVPDESALGMASIAEEVKSFTGFSHSDLANSGPDRPQVRDWVEDKLRFEVERLRRRDPMEKLCLRDR